MGSVVDRPASFCMFCVVISLCAAAGVDAQNPRPAPAQTDPASRRFVVIGCLSREARPSAGANRPAGNTVFTLTDSRGDKPSVYRLVGDEAQLGLHAGHTVEIAGALSRAGAADTTYVLKVEKLTWIASTCRTAP